MARDTTNLTPDQLEEFEAVFLHFDRERNNLLKMEEFGAALASLGMNYEQDEMEQVFFDVSGGTAYVNFEQFIGFMVNNPKIPLDTSAPWVRNWGADG